MKTTQLSVTHIYWSCCWLSCWLGKSTWICLVHFSPCDLHFCKRSCKPNEGSLFEHDFLQDSLILSYSIEKLLKVMQSLSHCLKRGKAQWSYNFLLCKCSSVLKAMSRRFLHIPYWCNVNHAQARMTDKKQGVEEDHDGRGWCYMHAHVWTASSPTINSKHHDFFSSKNHWKVLNCHADFAI